VTEDPEGTSYAIEYIVRVDAENPTVARVRWNFAGIDEVKSVRLGLGSNKFHNFSGTGKLEVRAPDEILWTPQSPYAHLEYIPPRCIIDGFRTRASMHMQHPTG
jgi:hypothetical protein